jgi:hypothetical protein
VARRVAELAVDKGFGSLSSILPRHQYIHIPAFAAKDHAQFTPRQIVDSQDMARIRYAVEVGISRPASWERFDHVVRRQDFHNYDNVTFTVAGMSVLLKPIMRPAKFPKAKSILAAYAEARDKAGEPFAPSDNRNGFPNVQELNAEN